MMENDSSKEENQKNSKGEKRKHRSRSRSKSRSPKHRKIIDYDIPDRSHGDLFCRACDCHMNGEQIWESHIQGKRHLKNKKSGAPVDQKYEYLDEDPIIQSEIDDDTRPIVGLDHICEIRRLEQMPIYSCFLCSATLPNGPRLIEHILTLKHRQAFLKEHDLVEYSTIQSAQLKKCHLESIVEECIVKYVEDHGRGKMIVKKEKNKTASSSYEKGYSSDYDSHSNHKYSRHEKSLYSEWKKVSSSSSRYHERERHSSDYRSDFDIDDHDYSKEEPQSRSAYYRTALGKEGSPPKSIRSTTGSRYYSREEPESRSTYYQRSSVKEANPPKIRSASSSRHYSEEEPESRSSFYQASLVKEISPPEIGRNDGGSRYYSEEAPESRSTYYQSAVKEASPPKIMQSSSGSSHLWAVQQEKVDLRNVLEQKKSLGTSCRTNADISEPYWRFIRDLTPEVYIRLSLFKVPFHENMAQNGLYPQSNVDLNQNLNNLMQHYKSQKSSDTSHNQFQNSGVLDRSDLPFPQSNSNYHPAQFNSGNYSRSLAPSENTSALSSTSLDYMGNQNSNLIPFKGFSSTPSSIPGFTFGEEIDSKPENPGTRINQLQSPFEHFSENAKNILGYFNRPLSKGYNNR
ncbi:uncharacterized protein TNIN_457831 [Trichonephila inaurata madagascariensis]|uniref:C2H2-type domain-containing protein n=1 Tax=Trichonephila inaurata madagascariensis TaxID=2747483 RepID=A0A8X6XAH9_9ARAC|nr:uncharacterized protein TNIN_457831 [Trichonephila inaurata madagascariensis]